MENDVYRIMYCRLFNKVTDTINTTSDPLSAEKLIRAQQETEEIFISYEESNNIIPLFDKPDHG